MLAAALAWGAGGCGTLGGGRSWGEDATLLPGAARVRKAAWAAVSDGYTWGPAAGAAVFGLAGWDRTVSDWARERTPVFGSGQGAHDGSDAFVVMSCGGLLGSALAAPAGDGWRQSAAARGGALALEAGVVGATVGLAEGLKGVTGRARPDGSDRASLPSGHAAAAFSCSALTRRNLVEGGGDGLRTALGVSSTVAAAAAGWARVEAGKHYPSDVLAAAALANFLSVFSYEAFVAGDTRASVSLSFAPAGRVPLVVLGYRR